MSEKIVFKVAGMTCNHCKKAVEKALVDKDGVLSAEVDLSAGSASIEYNSDKVNVSALEEAIIDAGYEIVR